jgi:hypothetical protein
METFEPQHMLQVVSRCFQIMMSYNEEGWRRESDVVLMPDVGAIPWDGFQNSMLMIEAGERAAEQALPQIREWLGRKEAAEVEEKHAGMAVAREKLPDAS